MCKRDGSRSGELTASTLIPSAPMSASRRVAYGPAQTAVRSAMRTFASRIPDFQPNSWITHVSGHPPGALLTFVWLNRIGLGGGTWAGLLCMLVGSSAAAALRRNVFDPQKRWSGLVRGGVGPPGAPRPRPPVRRLHCMAETVVTGREG